MELLQFPTKIHSNSKRLIIFVLLTWIRRKFFLFFFEKTKFPPSWSCHAGIIIWMVRKWTEITEYFVATYRPTCQLDMPLLECSAVASIVQLIDSKRSDPFKRSFGTDRIIEKKKQKAKKCDMKFQCHCSYRKVRNRNAVTVHWLSDSINVFLAGENDFGSRARARPVDTANKRKTAKLAKTNSKAKTPNCTDIHIAIGCTGIKIISLRS